MWGGAPALTALKSYVVVDGSSLGSLLVLGVLGRADRVLDVPCVLSDGERPTALVRPAARRPARGVLCMYPPAVAPANVRCANRPRVSRCFSSSFECHCRYSVTSAVIQVRNPHISIFVRRPRSRPVSEGGYEWYELVTSFPTGGGEGMTDVLNRGAHTVCRCSTSCAFAYSSSRSKPSMRVRGGGAFARYIGRQSRHKLRQRRARALTATCPLCRDRWRARR